MNQAAVFAGTTYRLLETISGLDEARYFLCESEDGERFVCPLDRWEAAAPVPTTKVHAKSSSQEKIALFLALFHGRDDVYARRWYIPFRTQTQDPFLDDCDRIHSSTPFFCKHKEIRLQE